MAETQTNVEFKIIETDNQTKVPFDKGQYIIEDGSKVYYDPTNGTSIADRIEIGSADIEELRRELTGLYSYRGSTATLPTTGLRAGYVWDLSRDIGAETHGVSLTSTGMFSEIIYTVIGDTAPYTHKLSVMFPKNEVTYPTNYTLMTVHSIIIAGMDFMEEATLTDIVDDGNDIYLYFEKIDNASEIPEWRLLEPASTVSEATFYFANNKFLKGDNIAWTAEGYWDKLAADYAPKEYVKEYVDEIYAYVDNLVGGLEDEIDTIIEDGV